MHYANILGLLLQPSLFPTVNQTLLYVEWMNIFQKHIVAETYGGNITIFNNIYVYINIFDCFWLSHSKQDLDLSWSNFSACSLTQTHTHTHIHTRTLHTHTHTHIWYTGSCIVQIRSHMYLQLAYYLLLYKYVTS